MLFALHADDTHCAPLGCDGNTQVRRNPRAHPGCTYGLGSGVDGLVEQQRLAGLDDLPGQAGAQRQCGKIITVYIGEADELGGLVHQGHIDDVGLKCLPHPIAHGADEFRQIDPGRQRLAQGIDGGQFVGPLLGLGLRGAGLSGAKFQLCSAGCNLGFQSFTPADIAQGNGRLRGQHAEQVTVAVTKAAKRALDVCIEIAQYLPLCHQWRDHAAALIDRRNSHRAMAQAQ